MLGSTRPSQWFFASTEAVRDRLREAEGQPFVVVQSFRDLGVGISVDGRFNCDVRDERLKAARPRLQRIRCLPGAVARRGPVAAASASSVAVYGAACGPLDGRLGASLRRAAVTAILDGRPVLPSRLPSQPL